MVRSTTATDDESTTNDLAEFAEYFNGRTGNFGAYVEDRNIESGDDAVVVYVGTTGSTAKVLSIGQGAGWSVYDVEDDDGSTAIVFIPPRTDEWLNEVEAKLAARDFGGDE